jgi:hypothetical protein
MIRFIKSIFKKMSAHLSEVSRGLEEIRNRGLGPKS